MRKSHDVLGLPIIHLHTGKKIGTVCDLLFDSTLQFRGVMLENGIFIKRRMYIPHEHIMSIGKDAVIVDSKDVSLPIDATVESWMSILYGHHKLRGRPVLLSNGSEIGMVENVYFLEEMGTLIGYEISEGLLHDLQHGRKMLKSDQPLLWGEDVLIAQADHIQLQDAR